MYNLRGLLKEFVTDCLTQTDGLMLLFGRPKRDLYLHLQASYGIKAAICCFVNFHKHDVFQGLRKEVVNYRENFSE